LLVLIDESGCAGFKLDKGSSPYFTLAMVIFNDFLEAEKASKKIAELKEGLRISNEFKFCKTHPNIRDKFFSSVSDCKFSVRALFVDKVKITSSHLRQNSDAFYNYFLKVLLDYDAGTLKNASIKIDGRGTKGLVKNIGSYLRKEISNAKIKKIKFVDSQQDNLIQLADMVVGAVSLAHTNKLTKEKSKWFAVLKNKGRIDNIWHFR
jgi:hypothetical protein